MDPEKIFIAHVHSDYYHYFLKNTTEMQKYKYLPSFWIESANPYRYPNVKNADNCHSLSNKIYDPEENTDH